MGDCSLTEFVFKLMQNGKYFHTNLKIFVNIIYSVFGFINKLFMKGVFHSDIKQDNIAFVFDIVSDTY